MKTRGKKYITFSQIQKKPRQTYHDILSQFVKAMNTHSTTVKQLAKANSEMKTKINKMKVGFIQKDVRRWVSDEAKQIIKSDIPPILRQSYTVKQQQQAKAEHASTAPQVPVKVVLPQSDQVKKQIIQNGQKIAEQVQLQNQKAQNNKIENQIDQMDNLSDKLNQQQQRKLLSQNQAAGDALDPDKTIVVGQQNTN